MATFIVELAMTIDGDFASVLKYIRDGIDQRKADELAISGKLNVDTSTPLVQAILANPKSSASSTNDSLLSLLQDPTKFYASGKSTHLELAKQVAEYLKNLR